MNTIAYELSKIGLTLPENGEDKLYRFYEIVTEKNKVMNLTTITDYDEFVLKHIVDSLCVELLTNKSTNLKNLINTPSTTLLDLGSGAGFPGIPLGISYPKLNITLLDSLEKRTKFLNDSVAELDLSSRVSAISGRAEEIAQNSDYREQYDICVSRAVANLSVLSEYAIPFVKKGGFFIAYKSDAKEELEKAEFAIKTLGGEVEEVHDFCLPDTDIPRKLILIKKIKSTPDKYPRRAGVPQKKPLSYK